MQTKVQHMIRAFPKSACEHKLTVDESIGLNSYRWNFDPRQGYTQMV